MWGLNEGDMNSSGKIYNSSDSTSVISVCMTQRTSVISVLHGVLHGELHSLLLDPGMVCTSGVASKGGGNIQSANRSASRRYIRAIDGNMQY